jgi:hypothetical protein
MCGTSLPARRALRSFHKKKFYVCWAARRTLIPTMKC